MWAPELFRDAYRLTFTTEELSYLSRPVVGDGGHQRWLKDLQQRTVNRRLELTAMELEKTRRYAYDYGGGGYQDAFKAVIRAAWRADWRADQ